MAYRLVLPPEFSWIHPVFHVSMLRKYINICPFARSLASGIGVSKDLTYKEYLVTIVDRQIRQLRTKKIPIVKVLWSNHTVKDCTWETEAIMWDAYPYLFQF